MSYTKEQVQEWKERYGRILSADVAGVEFVYRPLTLAELKELLEKESTFIAELKKAETAQEEMVAKTFEFSSRQLCEKCVLYPDRFNFETGPAGVLDALQPLIMAASGYPEEPIQPKEL